MLDLVECMLLRKGFKVARFDGRQQKADVRKNIIKTFRTNPECTVLLASLKAGGVGLNLLPARYLVLLDPWWNSSVEFQAFDRIHRIGQTRPVIIYKILVNRTIEEEVLKIQKKKQNQEAAFLDDEKKQILSVRDIHCVFTTMKTRQMKMMRLINTN
jgi:SNF2 family DNA or RNA helicase